MGRWGDTSVCTCARRVDLLQYPAQTVHVGLGYNSDAWTERIDAGSQMGTSRKTKRIHKIIVRLWQALGLWVGPSADKLDPITRRTGSVG